MKLQLITPTPEYFGNKIRVLVDEMNDYAPWFVGSDILKALEMKGGAHLAYRKLFASEKSYRERITVGMKAGKPIVIISESGFYKLIMRSQKTSAEAFQRWVCSEVLPSIRKYGRYEALTDEDGNPVDIPDVMVELVNLTDRLPSGAITEKAQRMHLREWIEEHGLEGMHMKYRSAFGKICRRLVLTHDLPILSRWGSVRRNKHWRDEYFGRVWPVEIIEMAYQEYLDGRRD